MRDEVTRAALGSPRQLSERRSREILVFCAAAAIVAATAAVLGIAWGDDRTTSWQLAARYTARAAFPLFLSIFVASAWQRLVPGPVPRWLVAHRRALGLAFATMFTVHLIALATYSVVSGHGPDLVTSVVGGGAFVTMYALVLTSNDAAVRRLGARRWRRLHAFGLYYLWFIFTASYVGRLARARDFFALFALACVAALVVRIVGRRRRARVRLVAAA